MSLKHRYDKNNIKSYIHPPVLLAPFKKHYVTNNPKKLTVPYEIQGNAEVLNKLKRLAGFIPERAEVQ